MVLEATMICVDDSEWMRNGDYPPTRLLAQADAATLVFATKTASNPENTVGVVPMAGDGARVLLAPTSDPVKFLGCMDGLKESGEANFAAAIQVAQLALKNRPKKNQCQRIIVFVGSPVKDDKNVLEAIGKKLKKNNVSLDVVDFGESDDEKPEKLEALVAAVNVGGNSHIVHIPPGEAALHDILAKTPIITADGGAAAVGASRFEYGVDPNVDPELALALRLSAEEERARQEIAAKKAAEEPSKAENKCESSTSNTDTVPFFDWARANTDTVMAEAESDSDIYVPFLEWIKTDPFATGAESASDTPADDERATEDGLRLIREALAMSANAANAEMSHDSSSGQELELDLQRIRETCFHLEVEDVFDSILRLDRNDPLPTNVLARLAALQGQGEQEEEEEGDEQEEEEGEDEQEKDV